MSMFARQRAEREAMTSKIAATADTMTGAASWVVVVLVVVAVVSVTALAVAMSALHRIED